MGTGAEGTVSGDDMNYTTYGTIDPMPGKARRCPMCDGTCREILEGNQLKIECTRCTWGELYWL